jgi:hypothetical protein
MSVVVIIAALIFSALTGWPLVALVLRWSEGSGRERREENRSAKELLRGGLWIGLLERVAVTGAVLLGEYTIVAAAVAVKGLGRFKELSTPEASERFVVGTLASLTWAGLVGAAARGVLALMS